MARPKPTTGHISPTPALEILLTEVMYPAAAALTPPAAAEWIEQALHNGDCHIWRNGRKVSRAEAAHLLVLANYDAPNWYASIRDARNSQWRLARDEYEFDANEIRALMSGAVHQEDNTPSPSRRKPGPKHTDDWPIIVAAWLILIARDEPGRLNNADRLTADAGKFLDAEIGWAPQDPKQLRRIITELLQYVR
jgi:hypothetical protein